MEWSLDDVNAMFDGSPGLPQGGGGQREWSLADIEAMAGAQAAPDEYQTGENSHLPPGLRGSVRTGGFGRLADSIASGFSNQSNPSGAGQYPGLLTPGNIDLNSRPKVRNADGSISTVRSMSFNDDGREVLIPTVSEDGRILSNEDAISAYRQTGRHLGIFDTPQNATAFAEQLHRDQERLYANPSVLDTLLQQPFAKAPLSAARVRSAGIAGAERAFGSEPIVPPQDSPKLGMATVPADQEAGVGNLVARYGQAGVDIFMRALAGGIQGGTATVAQLAKEAGMSEADGNRLMADLNMLAMSIPPYAPVPLPRVPGGALPRVPTLPRERIEPTFGRVGEPMLPDVPRVAPESPIAGPQSVAPEASPFVAHNVMDASGRPSAPVLGVRGPQFTGLLDDAVPPPEMPPAGRANPPSIDGIPPEVPTTVAAGERYRAPELGVPRTPTQLDNALARLDAERNDPGLTREQRTAAMQAQNANLQGLQNLLAEVSDTPYGRAMVAAEQKAEAIPGIGGPRARGAELTDFRMGFKEAIEGAEAPSANRWSYKRGFEEGRAYLGDGPALAPERRQFQLRTSRGAETTFDLPASPSAIQNLIDRLEGKRNVGKFFSEDVTRSAVEKAIGPRPNFWGDSAVPPRVALEIERSGLPAKPSASVKPREYTLDDVNAMASKQNMTPGATYTGFRAQTYDPAIASTGNPVRREAILKNLTQALGMPIYQGRIKSDGVLGFFRPAVGEVRIKHRNDIETASHEIAHLLDSRFPELRNAWKNASKSNAALRAELRGISYDKDKLYEGFAEAVRHWMTQPDTVKTKLPVFSQWFDKFVESNPYKKGLLQAREQMTAWFDQSALDRARSKIGGVEGVINDVLDSRFDRIRQTAFDDLHGIMRMEKEMTGEIAPGGVYETARLTRGTPALIEGSLNFGAPKAMPDGSTTFIGKGLKEILKPVSKNLEEFELYAAGRAANELKMQNRENLFTRAEINSMLDLDRPEFQKAFQEYQIWNGQILDYAQAKGIINPSQRALWRRASYVPFHRVGQSGSGKTATAGEFKGIKALTGGDENIKGVLENMVSNAAMLLDAAKVNEARLKVANLASKSEGAKFMAKIPKEDARVSVSRVEVERKILEAWGVTSKQQLPIEIQQLMDQMEQQFGPFVDFMQRGQAPKGDNIVAVMRNGEPTYYEVASPVLFRSLTNLSRPAQETYMKWLSFPKKVKQLTITLAFDFMGANLTRDMVSAGILTRGGFRPMIDSARGLSARVMKDPSYKEFIANGGGMASLQMNDNVLRRDLSKFYTSKGIDYNKVLHSPEKVVEGLQYLSEVIEQSTRLGEFKRAREKGASPQHAAYLAREVSTDFAMRGDDRAILNFMYETIPFFRAATVSMDRLYRGVRHDPNRALIGVKTAMLATASMGLYAINRDNPLYDQLEDWDKDGHWHFFLPTKETVEAWGNDKELPPLKDRYLHLRAPKIWEIGAVASVAERTLKAIMDQDGGKLAGDAGRIIKNVFQMNVIPQFAAPIVESVANKNFFTGRDIENPALERLEPWARSTGYTSPTMRAIGEATSGLPRDLQISPVKLEHLLNGYFGTLGMYGLSMADSVAFDNQPEKRLDQYPIMRRFYSEEPQRHTRFETELYKALREVNETRATMRNQARNFAPEKADELLARPENEQYVQLNRAGRGLSALNREMQLVNRAPSLEDVQKMAQQRQTDLNDKGFVNRLKMNKQWDDIGKLKRVMIDSLTEEKNTLTKNTMLSVDQQRRAAGR